MRPIKNYFKLKYYLNINYIKFYFCLKSRRNCRCTNENGYIILRNFTSYTILMVLETNIFLYNIIYLINNLYDTDTYTHIV